MLFQRRVGLSTPVECAVLTLLLVGCMAMESWRFAVYGPLVVGVVISRGINWAPARMLGPISYSLYLTHYSFGMWFRDALATKLTLGALSAAILALIASVCFAALFYWLIERPSLTFSRRISYARQSRSETPIRIDSSDPGFGSAAPFGPVTVGDSTLRILGSRSRASEILGRRRPTFPGA